MSRAQARCAAACLCLSTIACASASIRDDLDRVQALASATNLAAVDDGEVDPTTSDDVHAILQQPLDAEAAVRVALLNNRSLRAELRALGMDRGQLMQAGLLPNPVLEVELLPERDTQVELRVEYDLTGLVLAPMKAKAAESELEAQRQRAAGAVLELGYQVRNSFFGLLAAEARLSAGQRQLEAFAASRDAANAMLDAGNINALDASLQVAAYERARIRVAELELEALGQREQLQRLLGLHGRDLNWQTRERLAAVPDKPPLEEDLERRAVDASLDLLESKARLEAIAHKNGVARVAGWFPDVSADVHSLYGHPQDTSSDQDKLWRFGAGVRFSLPVFDRKQGSSRGYQAEFDAEAERFVGMAIELRSAVREAKAKVGSTHARAVQFQNVIEPAQKRVTRESLLQYNAMQIGVLDLLAARREELEVELEYQATLGAYHSALAELNVLLAGHLLKGGR